MIGREHCHGKWAMMNDGEDRQSTYLIAGKGVVVVVITTSIAHCLSLVVGPIVNVCWWATVGSNGVHGSV